MPDSLITSTAGVFALLTGVCAFFFWLEKATRWRLFQYVPPLVFIYLAPVVLSNWGPIGGFFQAQLGLGPALASGSATYVPINVIPNGNSDPVHPAYDAIRTYVLPMMLVLMLVNVDIPRAIALAGRGVAVMIVGALGVVLGAVLAYWFMKSWLEPDAWKAYAALSASWVGGTGNMAAVSEALNAKKVLPLAVLGDTVLLLVWLPVMLASKKIAPAFARFARVDPERVARLDQAAAAQEQTSRGATYQEYLTLFFAAFAVTCAADWLKVRLPEHGQVVTASLWRILILTTLGIALSFTPLRRLTASRDLGMALIFLFMAQTGAAADLSQVANQAVPFLLGAALCISIHGAACLLGAKLLRVDIHTAAIASAANIGGVATATCVAAHHKMSMTPAAILLALLGYALGNYAGLLVGWLCRMII